MSHVQDMDAALERDGYPKRTRSRIERRLIETGGDMGETHQPDSIDYLHAVLCQVGLPRSRSRGASFERTSGQTSLLVESGSLWNGRRWEQQQLPYGAKPRLALIYICSEAVRTRSPAIEIGDSVIRADRRQDIDSLKTDIDLCAVAATLGFAEDSKAGDRNHTIMRHSDGSKLIIGVSQSGHWVFSSNIGDRKGTVIDLVQWRTGTSVTEALARLRQWHRTPETKPSWDTAAYSPRPKPRPVTGNGLQTIQEWENANRTSRSVFLEKSRGLSPETLASPRFADTFRVDERQNAVFPYRTKDGLAGTERRNRPSPGSDRSFKAYTAGAVPGIWTSNASSADTRLVIVESPIDAMSHHELSSPEERATTRYVAIRNGCADDDLDAVIRSMPAGAVIIAACDRDPAGDGYTAKIRALAESMGRDFSDERPQAGDWNDVLRGRTVHVHTQPPSLRR